MAKKQRARVVAYTPYKRPQSTDPDKYARRLAQALLNKRSAVEGIEHQRQYFAEILKPYAVLDDRGKTWLDLGLGWKRYKFMVPDDAVEAVFDAVTGMDLLFVLERNIIDMNVDRKLAAALQCVFRLGYLRQFMECREAVEDLAFDGFVIRNSPKSAARRALTSKQAAAARSSFQKHKASGLTNDKAAKQVYAEVNRSTNKKVSRQIVDRTIARKPRRSVPQRPSA